MRQEIKMIAAERTLLEQRLQNRILEEKEEEESIEYEDQTASEDSEQRLALSPVYKKTNLKRALLVRILCVLLFVFRYDDFKNLDRLVRYMRIRMAPVKSDQTNPVKISRRTTIDTQRDSTERRTLAFLTLGGSEL